MLIRDATPDDVPALIALWQQAYATERPFNSPEAIERLLAHGSASRLLVAELDGCSAGTLIVTFDGWRGNMYRLAVLPQLQRRGIAGRLVAEAEAWLRTLGCLRITALVEKDHAWATGFWAAAGYELEEAMGRFYHNLD